ncbi:MAG: glycosyltransferase [Bacteroidetes bacterium]|jgi:glycosyltransferase involved in cell wall biosynthesis|nr:glycosyltransferase [Bacteroidota bacterium]
MMQGKPVYILQPNPKATLSGGYIYNQRIWKELKVLVEECYLVNWDDDFPFPSDRTIIECDKWLQNTHTGAVLIIDSLIPGTIPDLLKKYKHKYSYVALMHLPLSLNPDIDGQNKKNIAFYESVALQCTDHIVVTSERTYDYLMQSGVENKPVSIIPPGTDPVKINRQYPANPVNLLSVSHILPHKRQMDIIEALSALTNYPWTLTICGDTNIKPQYYEELLKLVSKHNLEKRIIFEGKVEHDELTTYYSRADLFIHASEYETYGMVVAEAISHKLPMITSDFGGLFGSGSPVAALIYEPGNIRQLQGCLKKLFDKPDAYKQLVDGYNENSFQLPDWRESAQKMYKLLNQ